MSCKSYEIENESSVQDMRHQSPYRLVKDGVYEGEAFYPNSVKRLEDLMVQRMMPLQLQLVYLVQAYRALIIRWPELAGPLLEMIDKRQKLLDDLNERVKRIQDSRMCVEGGNLDSKLTSIDIKRGMVQNDMPKVKSGYVLLRKQGDVLEDLHSFETNLRCAGYIGMAEGFPLSKVLGYRALNDVELRRVQWTGKLTELHEFVRWLIDDVKLITCPGAGNSRWEIASKCFYIKDCEQIKIRSLSSSSGIKQDDALRLHKCLPRMMMPAVM